MLKTRHAIPMTFLAGLALMAVAPSQAALVSDFTGPYDVSNWTQSIEGDGSINVAGAPLSIVLTGANNGDFVARNVDLTIAAVGSGTVSFSWDFTTNDGDGPAFDPFGYLLNGVFNQLTNNVGFIQSGAVSFSVLAGDVFGFRQNSLDSDFGAGITTISSFSAPGVSAVPEPGTLALLGLGLVGMGMRRRIKAS